MKIASETVNRAASERGRFPVEGETRASCLPPISVLRRAAREAWPEEPLHRFQVHDDGWTHLVLEADGRLMFRFPRWSTGATALRSEWRLLPLLSRFLSTRLPRLERMATLAEPLGWPFLAYRKIPGVPLDGFRELERSELRRLVRFLSRFLRELAEVPARPLLRMGAVGGDRGAWAAKYQRLQARYQRVASRLVPREAHRDLEESFRQFGEVLKISKYRPTFLHADLWPSHILWDHSRGAPMGVIDWEDAQFGDPAFDLTEMRGLGRENDEALLEARRSRDDRMFDQRLLFYRRIVPVHGLLFGLETGRVSLARDHLRGLRESLRASSLEETVSEGPTSRRAE